MKNARAMHLSLYGLMIALVLCLVAQESFATTVADEGPGIGRRLIYLMDEQGRIHRKEITDEDLKQMELDEGADGLLASAGAGTGAGNGELTVHVDGKIVTLETGLMMVQQDYAGLSALPRPGEEPTDEGSFDQPYANYLDEWLERIDVIHPSMGRKLRRKGESVNFFYVKGDLIFRWWRDYPAMRVFFEGKKLVAIYYPKSHMVYVSIPSMEEMTGAQKEVGVSKAADQGMVLLHELINVAYLDQYDSTERVELGVLIARARFQYPNWGEREFMVQSALREFDLWKDREISPAAKLATITAVASRGEDRYLRFKERNKTSKLTYNNAEGLEIKEEPSEALAGVLPFFETDEAGRGDLIKEKIRNVDDLISLRERLFYVCSALKVSIRSEDGEWVCAYNSFVTHDDFAFLLTQPGFLATAREYLGRRGFSFGKNWRSALEEAWRPVFDAPNWFDPEVLALARTLPCKGVGFGLYPSFRVILDQTPGLVFCNGPQHFSESTLSQADLTHPNILDSPPSVHMNKYEEQLNNFYTETRNRRKEAYQATLEFYGEYAESDFYGGTFMLAEMQRQNEKGQELLRRLETDPASVTTRELRTVSMALRIIHDAVNYYPLRGREIETLDRTIQGLENVIVARTRDLAGGATPEGLFAEPDFYSGAAPEFSSLGTEYEIDKTLDSTEHIMMYVGEGPAYGTIYRFLVQPEGMNKKRWNSSNHEILRRPEGYAGDGLPNPVRDNRIGFDFVDVDFADDED